MKKLLIYAEQYEGVAEVSAAELMTAASAVNADCETYVLVCGKASEQESLAAQVNFEGVKILYSETELNIFQDDGLSTVIAEAVKSVEADAVLIPATRTARAAFSRAAVKLNAGMTADCSELDMADGEFIQRKSAFGANAMCVCVETGTPKLVTVLTGVHAPAALSETKAEILVLKTEAVSGLTVTGIEDSKEESITGAKYILSLGRGALADNNLELAQEYAKKSGAMIGGTRPIADDGTIPFERQIGQTGVTVHPDVCVYMGVSGAIQHTEGVRDTHLTIAVNNDPDAAIFGYVDYGAAADMHEVLEALLKD